MPELPEVEVVKQSLDKKIKFKKINKVLVRNRNLRFQVPKNFEDLLRNKKISKISRKSKYNGRIFRAYVSNAYLLSSYRIPTKEQETR